MLSNRVIPVLLVKDHGLVKTRGFDQPTYVGDPINAIRIFNEKEVDELALLDIDATPMNRGPNFELVQDVASECFMPLAYGGGIRGLDDAKRLFNLGVEKVILRSTAATNLPAVTAIATYAGSSSVTVSVDVLRGRSGRGSVFCPGSDLHGSLDWVGHLRRAIDAGAGEILLNSVDRDGSMAGVDTGLISEAASATTVPLVAVGGVGSLAHIKEAIQAGADAVGCGSFFVFHGPRRAILITYPGYAVLSGLLGTVDDVA
ncbi:MAG TPA: HisA/HisF-related TIM barrel protein [Acidimicrobiia bacterium]|nr:HisA/HisF-related TIM barrel protein [Acidimicrobiia bacterium]